MNDEQWQRLRALFNDAVAMTDAERSALVDRELRDEPELRAELIVLLAADASAGSFLRGDEGGATPVGADRLASGSTIGPYQLIDVLGEGGFGVVYLAEQLRPIRRRVALKLIKPGMDTKQVIARFAAERQAMALMDHDGIAQVFDAGETDAGRPYFVMEYVAGVPITAYCDQRRLRIRERLELFLKVCDAVQHAHQKGIIHRDIKPSNVLVAERDGVASPKVIDFGIVKAAGATIDEQSFATREGSILGTLGYMSPEQAGAAGAELDTRSDIYSLGVLLYELLAGELPFARARLRLAAWDEALRIIREEDPPALAARAAGAGSTVETSASRLVEIAQGRSIDERSLLRQLKGDLDWITLRALEKDPNRRYASASEFSADIRRHLANEAVLARAPSAAYRVRKFARRHRVGVVAAAVVLVSIVAGGVAAGIGLQRAVRAERVARREADSALRVSDFLVELFRTNDPDRARGQTITARTLLEQGTRRIDASLKQDPHVRARLLKTLGNAHISLGLYEEGVSLLREALAASESAQPLDESEIGAQLCALATGLRMAGTPDSAGVLLDRSIALLQKDGEEQSLLLASSLWQKGAWLSNRGEAAPADSLVTLAIRIVESQTPPDTSRLVRMYSSKANIAHRQFDLDEAERAYLRALDLSEATGNEPTLSAYLHRGLASLYTARGEPDKAMTHAQKGVEIAQQLYPPDHPNLADALSGYAMALIAKGDFARAIEVREQVLKILRSNGRQDDLLAAELNSLGILYREVRRLDLAIPYTEESYAMDCKIHGSESFRAAVGLSNLARCWADSGCAQRADSMFREAIPILDRVDKGGIFPALAYVSYANVCRDTRRYSEADTMYAHAEAMFDTTEAGTRPYFVECISEHAYLRSLEDRHADAGAMVSAALAMALRENSADRRDLGMLYLRCAAVRARAGDVDLAMDALGHASACGVSAADVTRFADVAALQTRPDFPAALRTPPAS